MTLSSHKRHLGAVPQPDGRLSCSENHARYRHVKVAASIACEMSREIAEHHAAGHHSV